MTLTEIRSELETLAELDTLTDEQEARWSELVEQAEPMQAEAEQRETRRQTIARFASTQKVERGSIDGMQVPNTNILGGDPYSLDGIRFGDKGEIRSRALSAVDLSDLNDGHKGNVEKLVKRNGRAAELVLATGSEAYRSAFAKLTTMERPLLSGPETEAVSRAMSLTDGSGGYAVPFTLDPTVILTNAGSANSVRQVARVVQITSDTWNGVSTAGVTASWDAEASEVSDDAPTFTQPVIPAHKGAAFVPFSIEIGEDFANLSEDVATLLEDAKDRLEGAAFITGTGTGQPTGIVTSLAGTASEINIAGAEGAFALGDVYALVDALPARYAANAVFMANKAIYSRIRQFDTQGGAGLWERLNAGNPATLLGYKAYEASDMDPSWDITQTANNYILVVGDFRNYVIVDRVGLQVEFIPHLFHVTTNRPSGSRGWYAYWRTGADSVNDAAFRMLDVPTTL